MLRKRMQDLEDQNASNTRLIDDLKKQLADCRVGRPALRSLWWWWWWCCCCCCCCYGRVACLAVAMGLVLLLLLLPGRAACLVVAMVC